jgi:uncharacterized protein YndB with AHSA1/START domain
MATQRHKIRIDAGQDAVFRALSSAEGWSRWITPAVTGDFTVGGEIVCKPNGRAPIRLRITSLEAGAGLAWIYLDGPFAAQGTNTAVSLSADSNGQTVVRVEHETPPIPEDDLAACNTYWGILLGQLRHYCQTRNAATVL